MGSIGPWLPWKPPFLQPFLLASLSSSGAAPFPHPQNSCHFWWLLGDSLAARGLDGPTASPYSPSGETCLHQAAALGQRTICHYIVEAGASLMKTDQQVSRSAGHKLSLPQTWGALSKQGALTLGI